MKCNNCGKIFKDKKKKFCSECGGSLADNINSTCNNCGETMNEDETYCGECGHKKYSSIKENDKIFEWLNKLKLETTKEKDLIKYRKGSAVIYVEVVEMNNKINEMPDLKKSNINTSIKSYLFSSRVVHNVINPTVELITTINSLNCKSLPHGKLFYNEESNSIDYLYNTCALDMNFLFFSYLALFIVVQIDIIDDLLAELSNGLLSAENESDL